MQPIDSTDQLCYNAVRLLAVDAVHAANSGHPGLPLGFAPVGYRIFGEYLRHNPSNPNWMGRDRFVLSAGHGSAMLYALLHLNGYDLSLEDLKQFRQLGSKTPGHPEFGHTAGVEVTTGPLGQGVANAVGMALAAKHLAARYNKPGFELFDTKIYVIAGDGCMQEGVAAEAASLAGHLGLDNLVVFYDDNKITIDGDTSLSFTEDVVARFAAYGWHTQDLGGDGTDLAGLDLCVQSCAQAHGRPHLIKVSSVIGFGSPKAGTSAAHGSPLNAEELVSTRKALNYQSGSFEVPAEATGRFSQAATKGIQAEAKWNETFAAYQAKFPALAQELLDAQAGKNPAVTFPEFEAGASIATRAASGAVLNAIMPDLPLFMGGSADLSPSNNTRFKTAVDFQKDSPEGRYIRFGVREHAMGAILNGISVSGLLRAYGATFLTFSDYLLPAIRVAALSGYRSVFVFTHDSIGVGEDGPTHQPVEQVSYLRAMPGLVSFRPADANETIEVWRYTLEAQGPVAMSLTRQGLPVIDQEKYGSAKGVFKGGYVLAKGTDPKLTIIATGSEVSIALEAYDQLAAQGISAQLVSLPSAELFEAQDAAYQEETIPLDLPRIGVEAGVKAGLAAFLGPKDRFIGMKGFGASGPAGQVYKSFGITTDAIVAEAKSLVGQS